jgi:HEAT repeat protein
VIGDKRSVPRLIAMMRDDAEVTGRYLAAYALGNIGGKRATSELRRVLANHDEAPIVRGMAAEQLGWFNREAIPDLLAGLRDKTPEVRFWCAYAMGVMRVRSSLPTLRRLAASDYAKVRGWWTVKREANWAIKEIARGPWED